jgi:hypothetical protein
VVTLSSGNQELLQEPPPTEGALNAQLYMPDQQLPTARAEVASSKEAAAQKDTLLQERDQQLEEAVTQQLEHARSEILSLKADAARTEALLQDSQGDMAYFVQQVCEDCILCPASTKACRLTACPRNTTQEGRIAVAQTLFIHHAAYLARLGLRFQCCSVSKAYSKAYMM